MAPSIREWLPDGHLVYFVSDKAYRGDELPKELAFREGRLAKIRQAMRELESEAKEAAGQDRADAEAADAPEKAKKRGRPKKKPSGVPEDKAQKNFTDPESRIMLAGDKSFIQGYNAQPACRIWK